MTRKMDLNDFRAVREVLEPDDFALGRDEVDLPPGDLIDEAPWFGIMRLPDDVAIRTTNHLGSWVALLHEVWSDWIDTLPDDGLIVEAMLDCADGFQASIFNLVHGFYKESISALRNALETMALAAYSVLSGDLKDWEAWQAGEEIKFKQLCDKLHALPPFKQLEIDARQAATTNLFSGEDGGGKNAWARSLYKRLSQFSHSRGNSSNFHLWNSNGPIYSPEGMELSYHLFLETHAVCLILAKASAPKLAFSPTARLVLRRDSTKQYLGCSFQLLCQEYAQKLLRTRRTKLVPSS